MVRWSHPKDPSTRYDIRGSGEIRSTLLINLTGSSQDFPRLSNLYMITQLFSKKIMSWSQGVHQEGVDKYRSKKSFDKGQEASTIFRLLKSAPA